MADTMRLGERTLSPEDILAPDYAQVAHHGAEISASRPIPVSVLVEPWLHESERRLKELTMFRASDVVPVSHETHERALLVLVSLVGAEDVIPAIVPGFDGSVSLEWARPGHEFDILIGPDSSITASYYDEESGTDWSGTPYGEVQAEAGKIVRRFAEE